MALDASIYANIQQPKIANPLEQYAQVMQLQELQNKNQLMPLQLQQLQQKIDLTKGYMNRGQGGASTASGDELKQLENLAIAGVPGAKELFDIYKYKTDGVKRDAGSYYKDPQTGETKFYANPKDGITIDPNTNNVTTLPGAPNALARIAGANAEATEGAKLLPLEYKRAGSGAPIGGTVGSYLGKNQLMPPQPSQPAQNPNVNPNMNPATGLTPAQANYAAGLSGTELQTFLNAARADAQGKAADFSTDAPNVNKVAALNLQNTDAPQGGFVAPTKLLSGEAIPPEMQQVITSIANSRDPAKLQEVIAQQTAAINSTYTDPVKKKQAFDNLNNEVNSIQQFWKSSPQPAAPSTGGLPALQSPAEAEAQKAEALAGVKSKYDPNLTYKNDSNKNFADYEKGLNERVSTGGDLMMRIDESRKALQKFQAGGGVEARTTLAKYAQAVGAPDSLVNKIAGGDLAAAQEFQKLAAQQAMETLKQAMGTGGRITQAEFKVFQANNPNLDTDPRAIEKVYNFATKVYGRDKAESDALSQYKAVPGADMTQFNNWWANEAQKRGYVNPQQVTGQAKGAESAASPHPADIQSLLQKYGK